MYLYNFLQEDKNVQISMTPQNSIEETIKPAVKVTGQQVLIQLTVKTGLTMFFTLLKQSWNNKNENGKYWLLDMYIIKNHIKHLLFKIILI